MLLIMRGYIYMKKKEKWKKKQQHKCGSSSQQSIAHGIIWRWRWRAALVFAFVFHAYMVDYFFSLSLVIVVIVVVVCWDAERVCVRANAGVCVPIAWLRVSINATLLIRSFLIRVRCACVCETNFGCNCMRASGVRGWNHVYSSSFTVFFLFNKTNWTNATHTYKRNIQTTSDKTFFKLHRSRTHDYLLFLETSHSIFHILSEDFLLSVIVINIVLDKYY